MNRPKEITYGLGGFDESKPDNNIVEIIYYTEEEEAALLAKEQEEAQKVATRQALLDRLGITEEEAKILLG